MSGKCVGNRDNKKYECFFVSGSLVSIAVNRNRQSACLASVSPPRQTGIYRLLCHYRQAPRFFAPLRMTGKAGCLRSAGLMSSFCPSRQADIYRLLCHYRQAPRFFAPLRMTPRVGGLRSAGLMSSFCPSRQTGIYRLLYHYRQAPRFFADAQNDRLAGRLIV